MGTLLYHPRPVVTAFSYPDPAQGTPDPDLDRDARKATFALLRPRVAAPPDAAPDTDELPAPLPIPPTPHPDPDTEIPTA